MKLAYRLTCGFCSEPRVETIADVRLCERHRALVRAIDASAQASKTARRRRRSTETDARFSHAEANSEAKIG